MFNPLNLWKRDIYSDISSLSMFRLFMLNMKTVYSTISTRIVIIFSPLLVSLALSILLPLSYSVAAGQIFVTTLSAGTIWGMTYFSIRKSTIYENISTSGIKDFELYFSIFLTMLVVTFFSQLMYWISTIVFYYIIPSSLFAFFLNVISSPSNIYWNNIDWLTIIYSWMISITIIYFSSMLIRNLTDTEKKYFLVLIMYLLILIPFGGLIRPSMKNTPNGIFLELNSIEYVSMIFPQYHLNLFNFASVSSGIIDESGKVMGNFEFLSSFKWSKDIYWNITILFPIVTLFVLFILSFISLKLDEK